MDGVKDQLYNPLAQLAFGGAFSGKNFFLQVHMKANM
jgi:hypothetical protein